MPSTFIHQGSNGIVKFIQRSFVFVVITVYRISCLLLNMKCQVAEKLVRDIVMITPIVIVVPVLRLRAISFG